MNRGPEVTEGGKWNQALAVGRAARKYELRPRGYQEREGEPLRKRPLPLAAYTRLSCWGTPPPAKARLIGQRDLH